MNNFLLGQAKMSIWLIRRNKMSVYKCHKHVQGSGGCLSQSAVHILQYKTVDNLDQFVAILGWESHSAQQGLSY